MQITLEFDPKGMLRALLEGYFHSKSDELSWDYSEIDEPFRIELLAFLSACRAEDRQNAGKEDHCDQ